jgi:hypothetical protein
MIKTLLFYISFLTTLFFSKEKNFKFFNAVKNTLLGSDLKFSHFSFKVIIIFVLVLNSGLSNAQCNSGATAGTVGSNTDKICVGSSETFFSNGWGGGTWSSSNPAVLEVSLDGSNVKGVGKAAGTAYVIYTLTQANCTEIKTAQKLITVSPALGATDEITGASPQCQGNTGQVYSIPPVANAENYVWNLPSGWVITSGANTNSITVTVGSSADNLTVVVSNDCKTNNPKYKYVNITSNKTVTPTITAGGATTFCSGGNVVLTSSVQDNYLWSNGETTRSITVSASGTYSVTTVQNGYNCPSNASNSIAVTVNSNAAPTFTTAPSGTVCPNTNVTYTTESGKSNYVWNISGTVGTDYSIISGSTSATSNSVVLQWKTLGNKTVNVNYSNGCSVTSPASNTVTVNSPSASAASSSPQTCINNAITPITHSVTGVTSISTTSELPTGVTPLLSSDKLTLTISGTPTQSGIFDYTITLTTTCGNINATGRITVTAASVGGTAPSQSICPGTQPASILLTGNVGTVQWQVSSDNNSFTNINGATSTTLTGAQMGNLNATRYYMAVVTNGGCASANSSIATVSIITTDRGRTKGGKHICPGNATPTLTLYTLTGDLPYPDASKVLRWEYSDDINNTTYTAIPGTANLTTYTPSETLLAFRTYRAVIKSGSCDTEYSIETRVDVDAPTAISAQSTATQSKCIGTAFSPITVTATGTGTLNYQWYSNASNINTGGTSLNTANGGTTNSYTPQSNVVGTLYYYCIVTGDCGTATSAVSGAFITSPYPLAPVASVTTQPTCGMNTGTITFSSPTPATGITYSIDGTTYTNTSGVFTDVAVGTYSVSTKNISGCVSAAATVNVNPATNKTWNGTTSTNWNTATNWTPNGVPTTSDCVVIPDLTTITNKPVVSGNAVTTYANILTVSNKGSLTIESANTLKVENAITVEPTGSLIFENHSSLLQTNNSPTINTGKITYKRIATQIRQADYVYWSTPVSPQRLIDVSPLSPYEKFFYYTTSGWKSIVPTNNMIVGKGYIIRGPNTYSNTAKADYAAEFKGVPNNGALTGEFMATPGKFYLIGNPYPSGLSADAFIGQNTFLEGTLYFWTHNTPVVLTAAYKYSSSDYASYNMTGGVGTGTSALSGNPSNNDQRPSGFIGAGQSFFATGTSPGTVAFNNDMRFGGANNTQFFKSTTKETAIEKHRIWLNMTNSEGAFKQMLVGYVKGASNEYESKYDGVSFDANPYVDFYSVGNGNNYVIQARALPFTDTDEVPLGYRTTIAGNFTISIDEVDGDLTNQTIYLEDKTTNVVHDLTTSDYTFTSVVGTFTDRLVLKYKNKTLGTGDFENIENGVLISVKNKTIQVTSSKEALNEVSIYDITGKVIYNKKKVGTTELQISNLQFGNQVFLIKVKLENGYFISKKLISN